ncbi:hypothetical protein P7H19_13735 [Paenibacillus larvae]|nr:hypothetical protein [Paenibacillus larvae]MDT2237133.1 hypothetical protein [Paenibacillus larvae]
MGIMIFVGTFNGLVFLIAIGVALLFTSNNCLKPMRIKPSITFYAKVGVTRREMKKGILASKLLLSS